LERSFRRETSRMSRLVRRKICRRVDLVVGRVEMSPNCRFGRRIPWRGLEADVGPGCRGSQLRSFEHKRL
jgi:hypothetical protein